MDEYKYVVVPYPVGVFAPLSTDARLVFGLIWSRFKLSSFHVAGGDDRWIDKDDGAVYCYYALDELCRDAGLSDRTVRRCLDALRAEMLIYTRRVDYKMPMRIYVTYNGSYGMRCLSDRSE